MKQSINKIIGVVLLALTLTTAIVVRANTEYSVVMDALQITAFPRIQLSFGVNGQSGMVTDLLAKNFSIKEDGKSNNGPLVVLSPATPNDKIDLFILIDRSGNTENFESVIKSNVRSLVKHMSDSGADLKIYLQSFGNSDTPQDSSPHEFLGDDVNFDIAIDDLDFGHGKQGRAYGFNKIYNLSTVPSRIGAEKVALIINGSQFYDEERGESTTYNIRETVNELSSKGFITFVSGLPIKQLHKTKSQNTEDGSLSHLLPGGYLGSFSSDLSQIYNLLQKRKNDRYVLQYYSSLPSSSASSVGVDLNIGNSSVKSFTYPSLNLAKPSFDYVMEDQIFMGDDANIKIEVNPYAQLIDALELSYSSKGNIFRTKTLMLDQKESFGDKLIYTAKISGDEYAEDFLKYRVNIYSPDHFVGGDNLVSTPIFKYDRGIKLHSQLINKDKDNQQILWSWSGETVDEGARYQLYAGDKVIAETTDRKHMVDVNQCNKYQVMKLRVLLKSTASHPKKGTWSLFSLPAEAYMPSKNSEGVNEEGVTEKEGIELMFQCLGDPKEDKEMNNFTTEEAALNYYSKNGLKELGLDETLYYLTGLKDASLKTEIRFDKYRSIYNIMGLISNQSRKVMLENDEEGYVDGDLKTYPNITSPIKREMVYKLITQVNQTNDFSSLFKESVQEMVRRMRGNMSI